MPENSYTYILQNPGFNLRRVFWLAIFMTVVTVAVGTFFVVKNLEQYPYEFNVEALVVAAKLFTVIIAIWFWSALGKREYLRVGEAGLEVRSHGAKLLNTVAKSSVTRISFVPSPSLNLFALVKFQATWAIKIECSDQAPWLYQLSYGDVQTLTGALRAAGYSVVPIDPADVALYNSQRRKIRFAAWVIEALIIFQVALIVYEFFVRS